jgi:hypothetical protein
MKLKQEYRGLIIWLGDTKIDTSSDITASEEEILQRLKPNYFEQKKANKSNAKGKADSKNSEPSADGDSPTVDGQGAGEEGQG